MPMKLGHIPQEGPHKEHKEHKERRAETVCIKGGPVRKLR